LCPTPLLSTEGWSQEVENATFQMDTAYDLIGAFCRGALRISFALNELNRLALFPRRVVGCHSLGQVWKGRFAVGPGSGSRPGPERESGATLVNAVSAPLWGRQRLTWTINEFDESPATKRRVIRPRVAAAAARGRYDTASWRRHLRRRDASHQKPIGLLTNESYLFGVAKYSRNFHGFIGYLAFYLFIINLRGAIAKAQRLRQTLPPLFDSAVVFGVWFYFSDHW